MKVIVMGNVPKTSFKSLSRLIATFLSFMIAIQSFANSSDSPDEKNENEVIGNESTKALFESISPTGGAGGLLIKRIPVYDDSVFLFGGTGVGTFNRFIELGGSVFSSLGMNKSYDNDKKELSFLFTNFRIGMHLFPQMLIYPKINLDFGIGHIGIHKTSFESDKNTSRYKNFMVTDPGVMIMLNLTKQIQLGVGVSGMKLYGLRDPDEFNPHSIEGVNYAAQITVGYL